METLTKGIPTQSAKTDTQLLTQLVSMLMFLPKDEALETFAKRNGWTEHEAKEHVDRLLEAENAIVIR